MIGFSKVTVIVCTYNREKRLDDLISALAGQNYPGDEWDILVVDNASTDGTKDCVRRWSERRTQPAVHYAFEPQQGVAFARNRGFREADGDVLVYIDDDERPVDPDWLKHLAEPIRSAGADAASGEIRLNFLSPRPFWLTRRFCKWLGQFVTTESVPFQTDKILQCGGNMAITRTVMEEMGGYNLRFGRSGDRLTGGEDTDLFRRMQAKGKKVYIAPAAAVHHLIGSERMRISYFFWLQRGIIESRLAGAGSTGKGSRSACLGYFIELGLNTVLFILGCLTVRFSVQSLMMVYRSWLKMKITAGLGWGSGFDGDDRSAWTEPGGGERDLGEAVEFGSELWRTDRPNHSRSGKA